MKILQMLRVYSQICTTVSQTYLCANLPTKEYALSHYAPFHSRSPLYFLVVCCFCWSPHAKMSIQESDQTQYVHKTLQLCKVQWSRSTKECNWTVSRWGGWCVCNVHTSGQTAERKSLWADIQNLFINIGWMTNLWRDIFSLLQSIYFII